MTIGTVSERKVYWHEADWTITVYGMHILFVGARTREEAVAMCKRNLNGFKEV